MPENGDESEQPASPPNGGSSGELEPEDIAGPSREEKREETGGKTRETRPEKEKQEYTLSGRKANLGGVSVAILLAILVFGSYFLLWGRWAQGGTPQDFLYLLLLLLPSFFAHEALHALGWAAGSGVSFGDIEFGMNWKAMAPYAHCPRPMRVSRYRFGTALPGAVLGGIPTFLGLAAGLWLPLVYGYLMLTAAGGDLVYLWVIRALSGDATIADHPTKIGAVLK